MAASDTTIGVTEGAGKLVATRTVDSQHREKVVIGGAEDGESYVHLPLHDAADTGAPLKIGGRANLSLPTAVSANDRVNARFTLEGALATVNTITAGQVWVDGTGLVSTKSTFGTPALNNSSAAAVSAQGAGLRVYVTSVSAFCVASFTGAGYVSLRDDGTDVFVVGAVTAVNTGSPAHVAPAGGWLCRTTANTALNLYLSGQATLKFNLTYYVAP